MITAGRRGTASWASVLLVAWSCHCDTFDANRDRDHRVSVLFAGDTSYGENYQVDRARVGRENILEEEGYDYSFAKLDPLLRASDLVVINLETPITDLERSPLVGKRPLHWSDVERAPAGLRRHGIDAVSLANNHAMDFGASGLEQTLRLLGDAGIECFGAGMNEADATRVWRRDLRVGSTIFPLRVIGTMMYERPLDRKHAFYARDEAPGVGALVEDQLIAQVRALRETEPDAFVVVFPHWGRNYAWHDPVQQRVAYRLVLVGADLVLGHGAHMMQAIEPYRGKWIAYSVGNFMFNSVGRFKKLRAPPYSLPARLMIEEGVKGLELSLRFYPIVSDNTKTRFQPRPVTLPEFDEVVTLLTEKSRAPDRFAQWTQPGEDEIGNFLEVRLDRAGRQRGSPGLGRSD